MRQARVLGQIVVGAEPQSGDDIEIRVAGGEEKDGHRRRQRAQLAAQREAAIDVVAGLRLGADDYLTKDTSLPHLAARISALFRRSDLLAAPPSTDDVLARGPLLLDVKRFTVRWNGDPVDLTLTEFWMVHALARFPGHVKDRDNLMRDARIVVDDSTITSHVKRIRRKFQAVDPAFDCIDTVYGIGYRWNS